MNILQVDRKWYEIILWWELRRIPYNIIMYFIGPASFYISYVTIPLVYIIIGLVLNLFYTLGWIIELQMQDSLNATSKLTFTGRSFIAFLIASAVFVFAVATIPLII